MTSRVRCVTRNALKGERFRDGGIILLLLSCILSWDMFTFWFVNGVSDFGTSVAFIGFEYVFTNEFQLKILAYIFMIPLYLGLRSLHYIMAYWSDLKKGACPTSGARLFNIDWLTVGILTVSFPLMFQSIGAHILATPIYILTVFGTPFFVDEDMQDSVKAIGITFGFLVFLYANGALNQILEITAGHTLPESTETLGWFATASLSQETILKLLEVYNSLVTGPILVMLTSLFFAYTMSNPIVYEEVKDIPVIGDSIPESTTPTTIIVSSYVGTVAYLLMAMFFGADVTLLPQI